MSKIDAKFRQNQNLASQKHPTSYDGYVRKTG